MYILQWNTGSGKRRIIPIKYRDGKPLIINQSLQYEERTFNESEGTLTTVNLDTGELMQINTNSGRIERRMNPESLPSGLTSNDLIQYQNYLMVTDRYYCIMRIRYGQAGKRTPTRLYFVGKRTWKVERVLTLNEDLSRILKGQREPYVFNEGVAVNPRI